MRRTRWLAAAVLVIGLTSCGDDDDADEVATGSDSPPAAAGSPSADAPVAGAGGGAGSGGGTLVAAVGEPGDPDAFVLTVTDDSGAEVTTLPAGEYEVQVEDPSALHNVHLTGPGVEETTTVPEMAEVTWTVMLEAGTYTFVCDPHPPMRVELAVT